MPGLNLSNHLSVLFEITPEDLDQEQAEIEGIQGDKS